MRASDHQLRTLLVRCMAAVLVAVAWCAPIALAELPATQVPDIDVCFAISKAIVVGQVMDVERSQFDARQPAGEPVSWLKYSCRLEVEEVIRGTCSTPATTLIYDGPTSVAGWAPAQGEFVVVFLGDVEAARRSNVLHAERITAFDAPWVDGVRMIANAWGIASLEAQARELVAGCESSNDTFRGWCLTTLAGKASVATNNTPSAAREFLGADKSSAILRELCARQMQESNDESLVLFERLLADDPTYRHSQQRFDLLWRRAALGDCSPAAFAAVSRQLCQQFADRADDCVTRLIAVGGDRESRLRESALSEIPQHFAHASAAGQAKSADFLESLLHSEPALLDCAATAVKNCISCEVEFTGRVSDRLAKIAAEAEKRRAAETTNKPATLPR